MRAEFIKCLIEQASENRDINLLTGDLGFSVLDGFIDRFPRQFLNCGVAEQAMVSIAAGMASTGKRVFVYSIVNFATFRCLEQIRNDIAYHGLDVCMVAVGAGAMYGSLGYTHHGLEDIGVMRGLPGMSVYTPSCGLEVRNSLITILEKGGPSYLRLGRGTDYGDSEKASLEFRGLRRLTNAGDIVILATGAGVAPSVEAANAAKKAGISIEVWSVYELSSLEDDELGILASRDLIVTVEDHSVIGGLGSCVLEALSSQGEAARVLRLGFAAGKPLVHGPYEHCLSSAGLTSQGILNSVLRDLDSR